MPRILAGYKVAVAYIANGEENMARKRYVLVTQAEPGMILEDDVYDNNDKMILSADTVLTENLIAKLRVCNIGMLAVKKEQEVVEEEPYNNTYTENLRKTEQYKIFHSKFTEYIDEFRNIVNSVVTENTEIDIEELARHIEELLALSSDGAMLFDMLNSMKAFDDSTYAHSVNVALICRLFAGWLNKSDEETDVITVAGMLHDIGKVCIPDRIIKKPDKLTKEEYDIIKQHTVYGYNILKNCNVDERIRLGAVMHHERGDGSGYPKGLKASDIDDVSKIIAIADVYDAMTSARVYRGPMCPYKAIEIFEEERFDKYCTEYIMTFLERIARTYINHSVYLSNGKIGEIVMINTADLSRPLVKVDDQFINLAEDKSITIINLA